MRFLQKLLAMFGLFAVTSWTGAAADDAGFVHITPDAVQWKKASSYGVEVAVLAGDPAKPGSVYVQWVKFPPGTFSVQIIGVGPAETIRAHPGDEPFIVLPRGQ